MDSQKLEAWIESIKKDEKNEKLDINVSLLYLPVGCSKSIENLTHTKFEVDPNIRKSMLDRLSKAYSKKKLKDYDFEDFDLIANNDKTYYCCSKDKFSNLKSGMDRIINIPGTKKFDKNNLVNVLSSVVEFAGEKTTSYAFVGTNNFNSLVNSRTAFFGNVGEKTLKNFSDDKAILGIIDRIDFVYMGSDSSAKFVINPKGKGSFERVFLLIDEYKIIGKSVAKSLATYKEKLHGVEGLYTDLYGADSGSRPLVDKMLTKMYDKKRSEKLKNLLEDEDEFKSRLKSINEFKNDARFKEKFKNLDIDLEKGIINYNKTAIFPFIAVLSDRPKETILLRENELGN